MGLPQTSAVSLLSFLWTVIEYPKPYDNSMEVRFQFLFGFSFQLRSFLPFLRLSMAVVLLMAHVFLLLEPLGNHLFSLFLFLLNCRIVCRSWDCQKLLFYEWHNGSSSQRISSDAVLLKLRIHRLWFLLCFANQILILIVPIVSNLNPAQLPV